MKDKGRKFSLPERFGSFRYAFNGIIELIKHEHNFRIHLVIVTIVILAGIILGISATDWLAITFVSAMVLISESFNSSIEALSDSITDKTDERIRKAKDIGAAAVLISAVTAIITGLIVFIPVILKLFA